MGRKTSGERPFSVIAAHTLIWSAPCCRVTRNSSECSLARPDNHLQSFFFVNELLNAESFLVRKDQIGKFASAAHLKQHFRSSQSLFSLQSDKFLCLKCLKGLIILLIFKNTAHTSIANIQLFCHLSSTAFGISSQYFAHFFNIRATSCRAFSATTVAFFNAAGLLKSFDGAIYEEFCQFHIR